MELGESVKVDLFVIASMAVDPRSGCHVGPRGSIEELEYGMLRAMKAVGKKTPVVTMADSYSVIKGMRLESEMLCSKVPASIVCTAKRTFRTPRSSPKLSGIDYEKLGQRRLRSSRLLRKLRVLSQELPGKATPDATKAPAQKAATTAARAGKGGRAGA